MIPVIVSFLAVPVIRPLAVAITVRVRGSSVLVIAVPIPEVRLGIIIVIRIIIGYRHTGSGGQKNPQQKPDHHFFHSSPLGIFLPIHCLKIP
jgi:hypothetical protein